MGTILMQVPKGSNCRTVVTREGAKLDSQWVKAPFESDKAEGYVLFDAASADAVPAEGPAPASVPGSDWARVADGKLILSLGAKEIVLNDRLQNRSLETPGNLDYDPAFEAQPGTYPLFNADSTVETVSDGPLARVVRVRSKLKELGSGVDFHGASVSYDLIRYHDKPLIEILAAFSADEYAMARGLSFASVEFQEDAVIGWVGGLPLIRGTFDADSETEGFLSRSLPNFLAVMTGAGTVGFIGAHPTVSKKDGTVTLTGDACQVGRDLRAYGYTNAYRANLYYAEETDLSDWVSELSGRAYADCETHTEIPVWIRAGALSASLVKTPGGLALRGLHDAERAWLSRGEGELFSLMFWDTTDSDREYRIDSLAGWKSVSVVPGVRETTILFGDPEDPAFGGISVAVTAFAVPGKSRIEWETDVKNGSDLLSLVHSGYPSISYDVRDRTSVLFIKTSGRVFTDMDESSCHIHYPYPSYSGSMQYLAAWREGDVRGLYFGVHDQEGAPKQFYTEIGAHSHIGRMSSSTDSVGMGEPGNGQKLPGRAVWQLFDGDWFDATMIYRDWVLKHANWVPDPGHADTPGWMRDLPMWFNQTIGSYEGNADAAANAGTWADELIEAREDLGVPTGVHMYNWHQIPFDNDYPHYKPAKLTFMENIDRLHEADIKVMPYINARLWDTHDRREKDWMFSRKAKPFATTTRDGKPMLEQYLAKEVDGSPVRLAPMCPSTAVWQEKVREICGWLMNEIGVDAVYLDQIAAARPLPCLNREHAHRPGSGSWWQYAYYNLLDHLHEITPPDHGYTTECNAEVYMRKIHAYLTWHWTESGQVPAFPAVYAGYIGMFGRCYTADTANHLRILMGQSFLFGEQMGWISPRGYLDSPYRDLYRKLVRARYEYRDWFTRGMMRRPPEIRCDAQPITAPCHMGGSDLMVWPAVSGAVWKRNDNGKRILAIVNLSDKPAKADVCAGELMNAKAMLKCDADGALEFRDGRCSLAIPGRGLVIAEFG